MLRPHYKMCLAAFVLDFAVMIGMTAIPFFIMQQLGGSAAMLGLFGGLQAVAYAFTCLLSSGFVARAKNGLLWALFGVFAYTVCVGVIPFSRNPWIFYSAAVLAHMSLAFVWPALHSWIGAEPDLLLRAKRIALFNVSWSVGFTVSPLFGGPLFDADYRLPFIVLSILCGAVLYIIWSLPHEKAYFGSVTQEMLAARGEHDRASEIYLYAAWCATAVANVLAGVTRSVYTERVALLVASKQLRFLFETEPPAILQYGAATKYSWMAAILAGATALTFLIMGRTTGWRHRMEWLFAFQAAAGGAFWILGHTTSLVVMMAAFGVVGVNLGVSFFSSTYYSLANPEHKHRRAALNEAAVGMGGIVTVSFGLFVAKFGFGPPFHYLPLALGGVILLELALVRWGRTRVDRAAPQAPSHGPVQTNVPLDPASPASGAYRDAAPPAPPLSTSSGPPSPA